MCCDDFEAIRLLLYGLRTTVNVMHSSHTRPPLEKKRPCLRQKDRDLVPNTLAQILTPPTENFYSAHWRMLLSPLVKHPSDNTCGAFANFFLRHELRSPVLNGLLKKILARCLQLCCSDSACRCLGRCKAPNASWICSGRGKYSTKEWCTLEFLVEAASVSGGYAGPCQDSLHPLYHGRTQGKTISTREE